MSSSAGEFRGDRERRAAVRVDCVAPSSVIFDDKVHVFCSILNISDRGACVTLPGQYRMRVGECFTLEARWLGPRLLPAVVVRQDGATMSCAFGAR